MQGFELTAVYLMYQNFFWRATLISSPRRFSLSADHNDKQNNFNYSYTTAALITDKTYKFWLKDSDGEAALKSS
ncbi:MAG: hypothetical protein F6K24_19970 [Okeania sp. SIO2D1]|nr:hypothetical protein [Okeania sp. SIO2D1]